MRHRFWFTAWLCFTSISMARADEYVWWEAETPLQTNFPATSDFDPSQWPTRDRLSGGKWLSASGTRAETDNAELFAKYRIELPAAGEYRLWTRKFWRHGPFRWQIDDGPWQTCPREAGLVDETP